MNSYYLGVFFAFLSAFMFGTNNIIVRIGTLRYPPRITVPSTLFTGLILIGATILARANCNMAGVKESLPYYVAAGILSFGLARYFFYLSVSKVGATLTGILISGNVILTGVLGALFLNEPSTINVWIGLALFMYAVVLASGPSGDRVIVGKKKDLFYGGIASLIVATANIIVRAGNVSGGDPVIGLGISYLTGLLLYVVVTPQNTLQGLRLVFQGRFIVILMGVIVTLGQLFRYVSLKYVPAVLATPVTSSSMFYTVLLVGFIPQAKEKPGARQALGVILGFIAIAIIYLVRV